MANKNIFKSVRGKLEKTTTRNDLSAKALLARLASTGCLGGTYYAFAEMQPERIIAAAMQVEPDFVAKAAIYARRRGFTIIMDWKLVQSVEQI